VLYIIYQLELLKWPKYLTAEPRAGDRFVILFKYEPIITMDIGPYQAKCALWDGTAVTIFLVKQL